MIGVPPLPNRDGQLPPPPGVSAMKRPTPARTTATEIPRASTHRPVRPARQTGRRGALEGDEPLTPRADRLRELLAAPFSSLRGHYPDQVPGVDEAGSSSQPIHSSPARPIPSGLLTCRVGPDPRSSAPPPASRTPDHSRTDPGPDAQFDPGPSGRPERAAGGAESLGQNSSRSVPLSRRSALNAGGSARSNGDRRDGARCR